MPFARNVQFETTFPDLGKNEVVKNRHGNRLGLLKPDPQVISRKLFTRVQSEPEKCKADSGLPGGSLEAKCDYMPAPFFNVLAAFWIQFMTHDWFSHLYQGDNSPQHIPMGCATHLVNNVETALSPGDVARIGCRPDDRIDQAFMAETNDPPTFLANDKKYLSRAHKTTRNNVTAWWDASQLYGYDEASRTRVKRDPHDRAKLRLDPVRASEPLGYLPVFEANDPINAVWYGQEATAFPDNWSIGLSFFHNVFAREHNRFVDEFRRLQRDEKMKDVGSGLRNPLDADRDIPYRDVTDDELFEIGRLVVSTEIAKIHTTEWTTQLLYDEPLYLGMNANWHGLGLKYEAVSDALEKVVRTLGKSDDPKKSNQLYSALAAGPGIFGLGNRRMNCWLGWFLCKDNWDLNNRDHINGGVNHFGSPFNFPEEFVTVYRLHTMIPDLIEYRELANDPDTIRNKIPVLETFRGKATPAMREGGLANWALSMGRQPLGLLTLQNHPQFLQNLPMDRFHTNTDKIDVAALDLIRDRERGVPRFNEFRRQYGLKTLTSFDDFVDTKLDAKDPVQKVELARQRALVETLREIYGTHACNRNTIITTAQVNDDGTPINDCLGHEKGKSLDETVLVDNIEDVDTVVGWLAEFPRPHGFAISETQFQVFILNASRRLFSDRFFTSSFRPEFYTNLGVDWVMNNGPDGKKMERNKSNGHKVDVSPLKRVLQRTIPELVPELERVVNVFDPWARDRGKYYTLQPPQNLKAAQ
jgi:Animal haem peroxidase